MLDATVILGGIAALAAAGSQEAFNLYRSRRALPIRIHVNGTRGKSTVTRFIWAGLRASGKKVLGKTTGTAARMLLPDGSEQAVRRRGTPNIYEQIRFINTARKLAADAVVVECMAIRPDLQRVCEHSIIRSTIGVITSVSLDHTEIMGSTRSEIAAALAQTVPRAAVLVLGDSKPDPVFDATASRRGTQVVLADRSDEKLGGISNLPSWDRSNMAVALAVTRLLGVADEVAIPAMGKAPSDPGRARIVEIRVGHQARDCLDASSANDPESVMRLVREFLAPLSHPDKPVLIVFNHRRDRPHRLPLIVTGVDTVATSIALVVTGQRPALSQWRALKKDHENACFIDMNSLGQEITRRLPSIRAVVICGNSRGFRLDSVIGG